MNRILPLSLAVLLAGCASQSADVSGVADSSAVEKKAPVVSENWKAYMSSRAGGSDLLSKDFAGNRKMLVNNFSYAGYQRSEVPLPSIDVSNFCSGTASSNEMPSGYRVFNVTDYGAIANDKLSDKEAIRKAIAATETYVREGKDNKAILFFPRGLFRVSEKSDLDSIISGDAASINSQPIKIQESNIVVKGCGSAEGGSELFMAESLLPLSPKKMWTTPTLLQLGRKETTVIGKVTQSVIGGTTKSLTVSDTGNLKPGDWIEIEALVTDKEKVGAEMGPYKVEPNMAVMKKGLKLREIHQIKEISGNTLTFMTPVLVDISPVDDWSLLHSDRTENLAVEDIRFRGNWHTAFIHHASAEHDSGYSAIQILKSANSWVKNVTLTDISAGVTFTDTVNSTVLDAKVTGNAGHLSLQFINSFNNLSVNFLDESGQHHSPGFSHFSSSNVHLDTWHPGDSSPDIHASQPRINLFDRMTGGWVYGRWGGAIRTLPNHLMGLVFWNAENTGPSYTRMPFEFMRTDGPNGRMVTPFVIGLHGNPVKFASQRHYSSRTTNDAVSKMYETPLPNKPQAILESNGQAVFPDSLFLAQLEQRLGKLPQWLAEKQ